MRKYLIITGYEDIDGTRVPIFSSFELLTKGDPEALFIAEMYYPLFELCELVDHLPGKLSAFIGYEETESLSYNLN